MSGNLTHTVCRIIQQLIIDKGWGTARSTNAPWPVYRTKLAAEPDNAICSYDTSGRMQGRDMISGEMGEQHGLQVTIRGTTEDVAKDKANTLRNGFDTDVRRQSVTIGSSTYTVHGITRVNGPLDIGEEESSNRRLFTINAFVTVTED